MSAKFKLILPFLIIAVLLAGNSFAQNPPSPVNKITLKVTQLKDGTWKVKVDSINGKKNNTNIDSVKVNKKTMITWEVEGTDAYFQFPDYIFDKNAPGTDTLSENYTVFVKDGHKLKLKIKDDDSLVGNTYIYSIFCMKGRVYAWGDSPPKIIVD